MSFNSVYTQIWRVLLHLAADPFPEVSDLAMKVLNSIAYKVHFRACVFIMNQHSRRSSGVVRLVKLCCFSGCIMLIKSHFEMCISSFFRV